MAKPIAGVNDYPYGKCGFIVNGVVLRNLDRLTNLRIYKQRSIDTFDLIDPSTDAIYQKVQLTGYDRRGEPLDYSKSDSALLDDINKNEFFVRGYNDDMTKFGFVIRFMTHKKTLSNRQVLYDMYVPTCHKELGLITVQRVTIDSTTVVGSVSAASGTLNENGMIVTLTTPSGEVYTTTVVNRVFKFDPVVFDSEGVGTITVTSPYYDTKTVDFTVYPAGTDSDYISNVPVAESEFVKQPDGTYSVVIPEAIHGRGEHLVIQTQYPDGVVFDADILVESGKITVTTLVPFDMNVIIAGDTTLVQAFFASLQFVGNEMVIPYATHLRENPLVATYDNGRLVQCEVFVDDDYNITIKTVDSFNGSVVICGEV